MSEELESRLATMKREIDSMQIAITSQTKPWYHDVSTYLSIAALLFSFGTTFVSYRRTAVEDVQNARQELRALLQRLTELPKEVAKSQEQYAKSPATAATISGFIQQENAMLARNVAEIAERLTSKNVSAIEYYSIAYALYSSYDLTGAEKYYLLALKSGPDFNSEIALLRSIGNLHFQQGKTDEGRARFKQAREIFSKFPDFDYWTKLNGDVMTEMSWAYSEANFGSMENGFTHVKNAEDLLAAAPRAPGLDMLRVQVAEARKSLESGNPAALPIPGSAITIPK
jgi:tetratricopeptide (TPR) repeat protein